VLGQDDSFMKALIHYHYERDRVIIERELLLKGTSGNPLFARALRYFRTQSVIYTA
jgi:hypothetical protein